MGVFQKYIRKDKQGSQVIGKDGKPIRFGPWFIQYPYKRHPVTGKIKYKTTKASHSKKVAERMLRDKEDEFFRSQHLGLPVPKDMSFCELMDWGLDQEVMLAKVSASDDKARVAYLKAHFGNCKATQVTPLMVDNFRVTMRKPGHSRSGRALSGTTVNKLVSLARRIYYLAMDDGIVASNPFARRGLFKEPAKGKYIPDEEFRRILSHLPDYLKPVAITAYYTGMRRGEILNLTWDRVDLAKGIIYLEPEDTKTDEPRLIFFDSLPELKAVFVAAAQRRRRHQKLVFTKSEGSAVPKWYMERLIKKACLIEGAGPYRFHDLRHTFNTNMRKAGVDRETIMKLTGHKTLAMFLRYSHLDQEQGMAAMTQLGSVIGPQAATSDSMGMNSESSGRS